MEPPAAFAAAGGSCADMGMLLGFTAFIAGCCAVLWLLMELALPGHRGTRADRDNRRLEIQRAKIDRHLAFRSQWREFECQQTKPANMPDEVWDAGLTDVYRKAFHEHCRANPIGRGERI